MNYRKLITFQKTNDNITYTDIFTCHAYINGLSGDEFFIANAGYEASLMVEIITRYCTELKGVIPMTYRIAAETGEIYELVSPADDIGGKHKQLKFRAKRIYTDV